MSSISDIRFGEKEVNPGMERPLYEGIGMLIRVHYQHSMVVFLFVHVQSNETLMAQNQKASCSKVSPISSIYTPIWQSPSSLQ